MLDFSEGHFVLFRPSAALDAIASRPPAAALAGGKALALWRGEDRIVLDVHGDPIGPSVWRRKREEGAGAYICESQGGTYHGEAMILAPCPRRINAAEHRDFFAAYEGATGGDGVLAAMLRAYKGGARRVLLSSTLTGAFRVWLESNGREARVFFATVHMLARLNAPGLLLDSYVPGEGA